MPQCSLPMVGQQEQVQAGIGDNGSSTILTVATAYKVKPTMAKSRSNGQCVGQRGNEKEKKQKRHNNKGQSRVLVKE